MSVANAFRGVFGPVEKMAEPPFDLVQSMNSMLPSERRYELSTPDQKYRVSYVIKLCPREEVLRYVHQVPRVEKIDAKFRRTIDFGNAFHSLVQNEWFGKWGWLVGDWECSHCHAMHRSRVHPKLCDKCFQKDFIYHELEPFNDEHGITAHLDGILAVGGKRIVVELKTANSMQFNLVVNVKRQAQEVHRKQVQMYMFLTGIKEAVILYFNKNESTIHQFDEKYDQSMVDVMLSDLALTREGMRKKVVPEQKVCDTKSCARAKSCPVRDICFSK